MLEVNFKYLLGGELSFLLHFPSVSIFIFVQTLFRGLQVNCSSVAS